MATTNDGTNPVPPVTLLSLDGGALGSWNFAQILILKDIVYRYKIKDAKLKGDKEWDGDGRISDHFNFIAGTGFGGIIAMLATKLPMSKISEFFQTLHSALFTKPEWRQPTADNMKSNAATVHRLVKDCFPDLSLDESILHKTPGDGSTCYTFTCASNSVNAAHPRLFTSYPPKLMPTPCTLRQAIELSLADDVHLPPYELGSPSEQFVGTAHRFSNPLLTALKEVEELFGPSQPVNCIVSVGAGYKGVITTDAAQRIIADGEQAAHDLEIRFSQIPGLFSRLNVKDGLEDASDLGHIRSQAVAYLSDFATTHIIDALISRERSDIPIGQLVFSDHVKDQPSTTNQTIPSPPLHLVGREDEKRSIIERLLRYKSGVIYGTGGIGKTSLVLDVLHDDELQYHRRYFLDCRNAQTLGFLYERFAHFLGIHHKKEASTEDLWGDIVRALQSVEGVVCLDNLETLWDQDELRDTIEQMLATLARLRTVSLLVTIRAASPPGRVDWAISLSLPLLSRQNAFQLFQTHSKCADDDEYAHKLVDLADGLPLVVELLGCLANGMVETTKNVWDRWSQKGTAVAKRGRGPRLDLNCSIELSLHSPQLEAYPTAQSTLYLLSMLPAGLDTETTYFTILQRGIKDLLHNLQGLAHQALVMIDNTTTRRYRLLAPIARYAADHLSSCLASHDHAYLIESSTKFIALNGPYTPENHQFVPSELPNIYSVLKYASGVHMDDILAEGIIGYAYWVDFVGVLGDSLLHRVNSSASCSPQFMADATGLQGKFYWSQILLKEAEESLDNSIILYKQAKDVLGEANSRKSLGDLYMYQDRLDEAEESLDNSIILYKQAKSALGEANSRQSLGDLYMRQNRPDEAEESLDNSIILHKQAQNVLGEANSRKSLGDLYMYQDRLDEAEESLDNSIILYKQTKSVLGEATSRRILGDLYMRQDRLDEAEESLDNSIILYKQAKNTLGEANSRQSLGDLYIRQNHLDEAEESLDNSIILYKQAQDVLGEAYSRKSLGDLYMRQDRLDEAEESLENSIILHKQAQNVLGEATSRRILGDLYMRQDRLDEAEESLDNSIILYKQAKSVLGEANSRQSLGDLYMRQNHLDEAEESLDNSLVLYQQAQDADGEGDARKSFGELYLRQNQHTKARASLHHSIRLYQQSQSRYSEAYSHKWLGQVHEELYELDEAEIQYGIAIDLHRQSSDTSARAQETTLFLEQLRSTRSAIQKSDEGVPTPPPHQGPAPHSRKRKLSAVTVGCATRKLKSTRTKK